MLLRSVSHRPLYLSVRNRQWGKAEIWGNEESRVVGSGLLVRILKHKYFIKVIFLSTVPPEMRKGIAFSERSRA